MHVHVYVCIVVCTCVCVCVCVYVCVVLDRVSCMQTYSIDVCMFVHVNNFNEGRKGGAKDEKKRKV